VRKEVAEAVGTYFLVVVGCGAVVLDRPAAAVAFFLIVLALIGGLGHVSGAHFNPAVSLSFWLTGRLSGRRFVSYAVAQSIGAVLAGLTLRAIWPDRPAGLGATTPGLGVSGDRAVLVEALLTALLMLVIASVATDARAVGVPAGLAIAAVVGATSFAFGPLTGASLNPARSLGPALAAGQWSHFWVYVLGPGIGAVAGGFVYEFLRGERETTGARDGGGKQPGVREGGGEMAGVREGGGERPAVRES
jgi:aquaporin NIP